MNLLKNVKCIFAIFTITNYYSEKGGAPRFAPHRGGIIIAVNYEYYRIFYFVAKYKNFTQAAKVLMSSQPNVTRCMNNLEEELGCRLMIRSNRGIVLTTEGEKLFSHVAPAYEQLQLGEAELASYTGMQSGTVFIGANETALQSVLLDKLSRFHQVYPGFHIHISNYSTPQAVKSLEEGILNLAVVTTPTGAKKHLTEIPLKPFREILVGGPKFAYLSEKQMSLKEVAGLPMVSMAVETKTFEFYSHFFQKHGLALHPDIEAANTVQLLPMIKGNMGLGFLPEEIAADALSRHEIFRISLLETIPERFICLIKDSRQPLSLAAKKLEEILRTP